MVNALYFIAYNDVPDFRFAYFFHFRTNRYYIAITLPSASATLDIRPFWLSSSSHAFLTVKYSLPPTIRKTQFWLVFQLPLLRVCLSPASAVNLAFQIHVDAQ